MAGPALLPAAARDRRVDRDPLAGGRLPDALVLLRPVGANDDDQLADFGYLMHTLGIDRRSDDFATQISRVESELLGAHRDGLRVAP